MKYVESITFQKGFDELTVKVGDLVYVEKERNNKKEHFRGRVECINFEPAYGLPNIEFDCSEKYQKCIAKVELDNIKDIQLIKEK
ncbi:MAG: hypothetical protein ACK5L6_03860 [Anaerorhabdus sp.]|uniref:hypothetical protein n=1 Tax=Anaerorhabdus sp. TaxID=1872524 RepID=UPI003A84498F